MSGRGVDNTARRKWDAAEYTAKAEERKRAEARGQAIRTLQRCSRCASQELADEEKRARLSANLGIVVRKPLNRADIISRDFEELRARVGTKTLVNPDTNEGAGFMAGGKLLRDSISYFDHINGKRQNAALGMSMRVERSTLEEVQERFAEQKRKRDTAKAAEPSFEARVAWATEEEDKQRAAKKERKLEKKKREAAAAAAAAPEPEGADEEMQRLMGFGGFASK